MFSFAFFATVNLLGMRFSKLPLLVCSIHSERFTSLIVFRLKVNFFEKVAVILTSYPTFTRGRKDMGDTPHNE